MVIQLGQVEVKLLLNLTGQELEWHVENYEGTDPKGQKQ